MKFKKLRFWLASKIIGGQIIDELDMQAEKHKWMQEQLNHGNTVSLEYCVVEPIKKRAIK